MNKVSIAVIGAGGVGGYFAFKLLKSTKTQATLTVVARGAHFEQIRSHGLRIESPESNGASFRPDYILKNLDELGSVDLALICVKDYDLGDVLEGLGKHLHENSVILPLMNGVDIYSRVKSVFPYHTILPACVYVASHIKAPGVIEHKGKPGVIIAGIDPNLPDADYSWITQIFGAADINFTLKRDASEEIRSKFLFIAAFGLITARYDRTIGEILSDPKLVSVTADLLRDYASILFDLNETEYRVKAAFERAKVFPYDTRTSLQLDIHSGKPPDRNELDLYLRPVIETGTHADSLAMRLAGEIRAPFRSFRTP